MITSAWNITGDSKEGSYIGLSRIRLSGSVRGMRETERVAQNAYALGCLAEVLAEHGNWTQGSGIEARSHWPT